MPKSIINTTRKEIADIILLGANYDKTSSFGKGASKGPKAIVGCLDTQIEFYERFTRTVPVDHLKIAYCSLGDLNSLSPEKMVKRVGEEFKKWYNQNKLVIMLGGEHSVSNGAFVALTERGRTKDTTILQIDAHADMRDTDEDYNDHPYGKYAHSSVMRRASESGFCTVQVGVRAYSKEEYDFLIHRPSNTFFEWGKLKEPSVSRVVNSIKTKNVYLTIDVDGIDPCFMPGTGTPVQGGLSWYYALELINLLGEKKNIIGADIVEVAPRASDNLTEYGAAQLCYNIIANARPRS